MFGCKNIITHYSSFKYHHLSLITHHPITHFLSLKNPQISPKPGLAPKPDYVFKSKNSKMWDPHSDLCYHCSRTPTRPLLTPFTPKPKFTKPSSSLSFCASTPLMSSIQSSPNCADATDDGWAFFLLPCP